MDLATAIFCASLVMPPSVVANAVDIAHGNRAPSYTDCTGCIGLTTVDEQGHITVTARSADYVTMIHEACHVIQITAKLRRGEDPHDSDADERQCYAAEREAPARYYVCSHN